MLPCSNLTVSGLAAALLSLAMYRRAYSTLLSTFSRVIAHGNAFFSKTINGCTYHTVSSQKLAKIAVKITLMGLLGSGVRVMPVFASDSDSLLL